MKQTAVEWFANELYKKLTEETNDIRLDGIFEQAKAMEKQQIIDAHGIKTKSINQDQSEIITGSQYYNETFKNK